MQPQCGLVPAQVQPLELQKHVNRHLLVDCGSPHTATASPCPLAGDLMSSMQPPPTAAKIVARRCTTAASNRQAPQAPQAPARCAATHLSTVGRRLRPSSVQQAATAGTRQVHSHSLVDGGQALCYSSAAVQAQVGQLEQIQQPLQDVEGGGPLAEDQRPAHRGDTWGLRGGGNLIHSIPLLAQCL